jgi:hypothetical protein
MRKHLYVRRHLAKLRDEHGFTDAQLMAVARYVADALITSAPASYYQMAEREYRMWYRPADKAVPDA